MTRAAKLCARWAFSPLLLAYYILASIFETVILGRPDNDQVEGEL